MTIDYFAKLDRLNRWPDDLRYIDEVTTRYHFLISTGHKKTKDTGADALREQWSKISVPITLSEPTEAIWQPIAYPSPDLAILPSYSFCLSLRFKLLKSYMSKDDNDFYVIDNPIVRDKVFKLPMVRPSSWKGSFFAALWQSGYDKRDNQAAKRLLGQVLDNDQGQSGRLVFFPTFFNQTSLEVINPHNRERKVGENPILFESVPISANGTFTLLYVPFDSIGADKAETCRQIAEDLRLTAEGIMGMMTVYGFGAKTSSGFGVAEERCQGDLRVKMMDPTSTTQSTKPIIKPEEPEAIRAFRQKYPDEDFTLKPMAWRKQHQASNAEKNEYVAARQAHLDHKEQLVVYEAVIAEQEDIPAEPPPTLTKRSFSSFAEMVRVLEELAEAMSQEGDE